MLIKGGYGMLSEDVVKEAIDDLRHGIEVGSIVFQMPEDEYIISILMVALEKQMPIRAILKNITYSTHYNCPTCNRLYWNRESIGNHCSSCGQRIDWS